MKEDKYTKSLAKNQVCAIFDMRDIWKNVLPKFIRLCCMGRARGRYVGVLERDTNSSFSLSRNKHGTKN